MSIDRIVTKIISRNDTASRWASFNPILQRGEQGIEIDTTRMKVGDGVSHWNDLPYMGESNVVNVKTHYDFPSIGRGNVLYKAESEKLLYQWNTEELRYEVISSSGASDLSDIDVINGGNANNE